MVVVNWKTGLYSFLFYGKVGNGWGLGEMILGNNLLGDVNDKFGVYQRRTRYGRNIISKAKYQVPYDPKTDRQIESRKNWARMMTIWKILTEEEKNLYIKNSVKYKLNRQQTMFKMYQKQRPSEIGFYQIGFHYLGHLQINEN